MSEKEIISQMRLIDANKITEDSDFIKVMLNLFKKCQFRHTSGCLSSNCHECMAKFFTPLYSYNHPNVAISQYDYNALLDVFVCRNCKTHTDTRQQICSNCGALMLTT